ncbi:AAA family ATPase [Flavobacterium orientale]|uniref:AAA ATPase domain-containing protein n=1 Tax=Flavobacterium orientale TaxID=1756020 RepID=A0A917DCG5_9FLAO|nr:AAA family ATPase [Flavobacterium orientale]GGD26387.1 hypothetical protein GCM10011343_15770 [Flavobacterium orientale]
MKSNFKIIALKALEECDSNFTKVLEKEKLYYFYSDYEIIINNDGREEIKIKKEIVDGIFNDNEIKNDVNINICAIVGKNGSGKSSIIELLFRAINNIAYNFKFESGIPKKTITADLKIVDGIHVEFYYKTDKFYKVIVNESNFEVFSFNTNGLVNEKSEESKFDLSKLFYTEAVNYSHYAYNSFEFGFIKNGVFVNWLKELFHKNDSYQTPLVLNPMRTEGNFDINRENDLVKQRLLANILRPTQKGKIDFRKFGDNLKADTLILKLKPKKEKVSYWIKDSKGEDVERFFKLGAFTIKEKDDLVNTLMFELHGISNIKLGLSKKIKYDLARQYIVYKLVSICKKYDDYKQYLLPKHYKFDTSLFKEFIKQIKEDDSHITFKLKQTLNYLKNDFINLSNEEIELNVEELSKNIQKRKKRNQSILELIPPPIFDIEIVLKPIEELDKIIKFSSLSSGEKQQIYMVSSLLYHLYNLDSVTGNKIKYENINIIFEEVELYFHPQMQKSFIKYFLDSISRIELKKIKSINICFVTHSPFILSDIPSNNIMFLEVIDGKAIQKKENLKKTFGANIHELLTDSFFMTDGFIGDFAKDKIDETINWLNTELLKKREFEKKETSERYNVNKEDFKFHKGIISLIDEPIIKIKLSDILSELDDNDEFHDDIINEQIENLKKRLKKK